MEWQFWIGVVKVGSLRNKCVINISHIFFSSLSKAVRVLHLVVLLLSQIYFLLEEAWQIFESLTKFLKRFSKKLLMTLRLISVMRRLGSYYVSFFATFMVYTLSFIL